MDDRRFDHLTKSLVQVPSRRSFLTMVVTGLGGLVVRAASPAGTTAAKQESHRRRRATRRFEADGPCGDGSVEANACTRDRDCCTRYCNRKVGRCRCRHRGQSCTRDRNCCSGRKQRLTCQGGTCQPERCSRRRHDGDVCTRYAQGRVRCCRGRCPSRPDCIASGTACPDPASNCTADCCSGIAIFVDGWRCQSRSSEDAPGPCVTDRDCSNGPGFGGRCQCGRCSFPEFD